MIEIPDPSLSYREFPGPVLLLAGPGTGKTWQLAMRAKFLIEERGVSPGEIAVITFTNEAARNMRDQFTKKGTALSEESRPGLIGTMHHLGNAIIGSAPGRFGLPGEYKVLEPVDRPMLLADAAILTGHGDEAAKGADVCRGKGRCELGSKRAACRVCEAYTEILRKCGRVDFDDQIYLACQALRTDDALRAEWQARARHLLVDEYQDINHAQWEMIGLLASGNPEGLFAVGDDDQSIYSFRGGSPRFIKEFGTHYGARAKVGRLAKSWRCPERILHGAHGVIRGHYAGSVPKPAPIFGEDTARAGAITVYDLPTHDREAGRVAAIAFEKIQSGSVLVLIPHNKYWPPIREALRRRGLAYSYGRAPVPTLLSRLATVADWAEEPADSVLTRRLLELVVENHDDLMAKVEPGETLAEKRDAARRSLAGLWGDVAWERSLYEVLVSRPEGAQDRTFFTELAAALDGVKVLLSRKGKSRAGLGRFLEHSGRLVAPGKNPIALIQEVRELKAEWSSGRGAGHGRLIQVYNLPSSKGLQGDVVLVIGLSEGLFPAPGADEEESARLLYVAMTRARKELHLFSARTRPASITFKDKSFQFKKSRFLSAIPQEHVVMRPEYPKKRGTAK